MFPLRKDMQLFGKITLTTGCYNYNISPTINTALAGYKIELQNEAHGITSGFAYRWFLMLPNNIGDLYTSLPLPLNDEWQEIQDKLREVILKA